MSDRGVHSDQGESSNAIVQPIARPARSTPQDALTPTFLERTSELTIFNLPSCHCCLVTANSIATFNLFHHQTHQLHLSRCLVNVEEAVPLAAHRSQLPSPQPLLPPQAASASPRLLPTHPSELSRHPRSSKLRLLRLRARVCSDRWPQPLRKSHQYMYNNTPLYCHSSPRHRNITLTCHPAVSQ
jgi:hypothetical protein